MHIEPTTHQNVFQLLRTTSAPPDVVDTFILSTWTENNHRQNFIELQHELRVFISFLFGQIQNKTQFLVCWLSHCAIELVCVFAKLSMFYLTISIGYVKTTIFCSVNVFFFRSVNVKSRTRLFCDAHIHRVQKCASHTVISISCYVHMCVRCERTYTCMESKQRHSDCVSRVNVKLALLYAIVRRRV